MPPVTVDTTSLLAAEPANGLAPHGLWDLRLAVARWLSRTRPTTPEQVTITAGAHHALALLVAAVAPSGSTVLVEETTYGGLTDLIHANGCQPVGIPRDRHGPIPEALATLLADRQPSLVVLISPVHSPTGSVSPLPRVEALAHVLTQNASPRCQIVLDETFGDLQFDPQGHPLAVALSPNSDADSPAAGTASASGVSVGTPGAGLPVIRVGSLSKTVWSGLRIGWIASSATDELGRRRWQQFDLGVSVAGQLVALAVMDQLGTIVARRQKQLRERADWVLYPAGAHPGPLAGAHSWPLPSGFCPGQ